MMKWFGSRIYRKIFASFLVVSLVPLCIVYFYINFRYSERLEQDAVSMNRLAEQNAGIRLSDSLTKIEYISNLFFNSSTQEILKRPDDTLSLYNARIALEQIVRVNLDLFKIMNQVDQVTFVKQNGISFDIINSNKKGMPVSFTKPADGLLNNYKNHGIYNQSMLEELPDNKLVYVRRIMDVDVLTQELGYLFVVFDKNMLDGIFGGLEEVIQTRIMVENTAGQVLYSNTEETMPVDGDWITWNYGIDNFGLVVTFYDELQNINANIQALDRITEAVIILSMAVILAASVMLAKTIVTPVLDLHKNLIRVRNGDFKVRVPAETKDELGDMGRAFNDMAGEIDRLVNQVYTIQLKEKEAAIAALQAQINPHFLYNTLDMIKSMADIYDASQVGEVIVALSGVFRYATRTSHLIVTVQDELMNLQNYMKIIDARFGGKIISRVEVPDELLKEQMIKICLQPLVENCISHGMARGGRGKEISVSIGRDSENVVVRVADDGVGIAPERLREIRENLAQPIREHTSHGIGGVGLKNIHDRIRLYYGEEYGVTIESEEGVGTVVTVCYPFNVHLDLTEKGEEK